MKLIARAKGLGAFGSMRSLMATVVIVVKTSGGAESAGQLSSLSLSGSANGNLVAICTGKPCLIAKSRQIKTFLVNC